jgi:putative ABC transport system substrate-binding protein
MPRHGTLRVISRRTFFATLGGGVFALPLRAASQPAGKARTIGFLVPATGPYIGAPTAVYEAFRQALRDLGYVEGRHVILEYRSAPDRAGLETLAAELVRLNVDVVVAAGVAATAAFKATSTIPVVFGYSGDPVDAGFIDSFPRPGRNMTGVSFLALELVGKRLELLKEAAGKISHVAVLAFPGHPGEPREFKAAEDVARILGMTLHRIEVRSSADFDQAFDMLVKERVDAIHAFPDGITLAHRTRIADFALTRRLPSVFGWKQYAEAGGLISYGPNLDASWKQVAVFADKVLKGAKPATLPAEQPTKFELVINLKTAKALGLTIPPTLLRRADHFIE